MTAQEDKRLEQQRRDFNETDKQRHIEVDEILSQTDPKIKEDILRLIVQFLNEEGYQASKMTIVDECNLKSRERDERHVEFLRLRKAILDGDWAEVDKLSLKPLVKNHKSFLYAVYKTQYLEYIDHHETQKAFTHLVKRIKPLEHFQTTPNEFYNLCYLLTTKSIQEVPSFKTWEGISGAREKLVEQLEHMAELDTADREGSIFVPPGRLVTLLKQAFAYQMEFSRYRPTVTPKVRTLLEDYSSTIIPNCESSTFNGHTSNVKCCEFVGEQGQWLLSGSSDNTCKVWDVKSSECLATLTGHTGRIWSVSTNKQGSLAASASGDGTVKIWDLKSMDLSTTIIGHNADVYSVKFHPLDKHAVSGGYDKVVRLFDIEHSKVVKTFTGHQLSVSHVDFSPLGNLIVTGSKDNTIKFWDIVSGLCIKTLSSHLGEVTSVEMSSNGSLLLSSSKDNSNRLWDVRMLRPIRKFKGHQNTSKNFIKSNFAGDSLITGGSEDGIICVWDADSGDIVQRLQGHDGVVYSATWNAYQSLFASCSDDTLLKTWYFK